jgi:hypothetical protein
MSKKGVYLRGIFPSRHKELCNILMCLDTGNLNQSVMSFKCAKDIMGEVGPIKFNIDQPCNKEFYEKFIVIDKMSIPINLSCEFMMKHSIECRHSLVVCIDNFDNLGNSRIFTVLDLTSAYHAMGMTAEAGKATAFCTKQKQYLFLRMQFGLTNAPASFGQLMAEVYELNSELIKFSLSYLDDIIIHSNTITEHFIHLEKVLECLCVAGLKLNIGKCHLFSEEVKFLGHRVSVRGISMDQEYLDKIAAWPLPVTGKHVQRYLGFLNYYSTYFQDFSKVTQPLNALRNLKTIEWTESLTNSFKETKRLFCQEARKAYPDWKAGSFILDTDFSARAFGVVLSQMQEGKEVMINCTSKVCNEAEQNYASWKGELCALIHAFKRFTHILRYKPFLVRTDSTCLETYKTWNKIDISGIAIRWILFLQSFDFNIIYRPGKEHINADYLSRDMLSEHIIHTDIESIEHENDLVDQIYNINFSIKKVRSSEVYDLGQRLKSQHWTRYTEQDEVLRQVRDLVLNNTPPNSAVLQTLPYRSKQILKYFDNLKIVDGLVIFSQPKASGGFIDRVCVPIGLYNECYSYAHLNRAAGHKGVNETVHKINKNFFMPYLQKYVEFQVANCITCLNRRPKPKHNHKIVRSAYSGEVLETAYIDHIGPITASKHRGRTCAYILIIVDAMSRFTFAYPVADCTVSVVVDTLAEEFVPQHGLFKRLVSDKGSAFTSNVYNQLMEKLGILKYHIPVRNPNSNPQERYNQNLMKYLKTNLTFDTKNWPKKLAYATLCANTSFNSRIGNTPFFLFHGRDPILPIDLFNPLTARFNDIGHGGFNKVIERIEGGWKKLKENTNRYLRIQNLHRQDKPLTENTICYIYFNVVKVGLSKKLQGFFLGPMIISKKYSNSLYLVTPLDSCPIKSKKPLVVARDKLYPLETKLELCPKEWITLDLSPSTYIHPDDCIMLDKNLFNNIDTFLEPSEEEVEQPQHQQVDSDHSDTISTEGSVVYTEVSNGQESDKVTIVTIPSSNHNVDLNIDTSQKGEGDLIESETLAVTTSKSASNDSKVSKDTSDDSNMSISNESSEKDPNDLSVFLPSVPIKRPVGRPTGSTNSKNRVATRYSKRLNKDSIADKVNSFRQSLITKRSSSRANVVESARQSRTNSRNISINEEEDL